VQLSLGALLALALVSPAAAQDWSGAVELRGNYYWETSTRVIAPELNAELEAPNGLRLDAHYLIDTITSASIGAGTRVDRRFTEVRHDVALSAGYEIDLGEAALDLHGSVRYSHEPDYDSFGGGLGTTLALNDRMTELSLDLAMTHDLVGQLLRGAGCPGSAVVGNPDRSDCGVLGTLTGVVVSLGWTQVLNPHLTLSVGYDLGILGGLLENPYRSVSIAGMPVPERHPRDRTRHTAFARLAYALEETDTAFHLLYRAYLDSWDIAALTPEIRIYQEIGDTVMVRARYRYYVQTRAFFQDDSYGPEDEFFTADGKMAAFESHLVGGLLLFHLGFLENTALDFAWDATLELGFEYVWRTNIFGDAIIAQAGLRIPF
jgi:hypothetical protein